MCRDPDPASRLAWRQGGTCSAAAGALAVKREREPRGGRERAARVASAVAVCWWTPGVVGVGRAKRKTCVHRHGHGVAAGAELYVGCGELLSVDGLGSLSAPTTFGFV